MENWQDKDRLGVVNGEERTRKMRANSSSLVIRMSLLLLVQGGDLSPGSFITVSGKQSVSGGCGEGQSDFPASAIFSDSFSLRYSICQGALLG